MRRLALLLGLAALAVPAAAPAMDMHTGGSQLMLDIGFDAFSPRVADVLTGDSVMWMNASSRKHTITADDGSFDSGVIGVSGNYTHTFATEGAFAYYCRQHVGMNGEIDVHDILLDTPRAPAGPNRPFPITGRTALPAGTPLTIEADSGEGFRPAGWALAGSGGTFSASVTPTTSAVYRAVADGRTSPAVQLLVLDRTVTATRAGTYGLKVAVTPATAGAKVVLQYRLKERFGWWPVAQRRLNSASQATLRSKRRGHVLARVVLTLPDGATVLAASRSVRLG